MTLRPRRDPRAERTARTVGGGARPRFSLVPARRPGGRLRRDPRAEHAAATVIAVPRVRLDRTRPADASPASGPVAFPAVAPTPTKTVRVRVVEHPAFLVIVVPDVPGGRLTAHDRQVLGAARRLAGADGAAVAAVARSADDLGAAGADRLLTLPGDGSRAYDPEGRASAIVSMVEAVDPRHVLFPETAEGGDLARRVAVRIGESLFAAAESLTAGAVGRAAKGHAVEQRDTPPRLVSIVADCVPPHAGEPGEARALDAEVPWDTADRAILSSERILPDPAELPLTLADFVASAGNGVTDFAVFAETVQALGATPGASRVVCDAGLMPRDRQVGASGSIMTGRCYVAFGIAGAPQHLQGIAGVDHVIAINTDLHAAMIKRAALAVVADAQKVMPALVRALGEAD